MFSKNRAVCAKLLVFGGNIYRQYGGWVWVLSNRKGLIALCKLLEPMEKDIVNPDIGRLMRRMKRRHLTVYDV